MKPQQRPDPLREPLSPLPTPNTPAVDQPLASIDALRGLACLAVFLYHLEVLTGFHTPFLGNHGNVLGVQLFFVLSGYLIHLSASKAKLSEYAIARLLRIYPAYWVALLGAGLLQPEWRASLIEQPLLLLVNLANLQLHYLPALMRLDSIHVSWTLTSEVLWYGMAPFVAVGLRRGYWPILPLLVTAGLVWGSAAGTGQLDWLMFGIEKVLQTDPSRSIAWYRPSFLQLNVIGQLPFFITGVAIAHYRSALQRLPMWLLLPLAGSLGTIAVWTRITPWAVLAVAIGLGALLLLALRQPLPVPRPLVWLGKVSFSTYLYHVPIISLVFHYWSLKGLTALTLILTMVLCASALSYHLVETPAMRFAKRWRQARSASRANASPSGTGRESV